MSDLQIGLIVLGVLLLAAVVAFNKWQEKKLARSVSARFGAPRHDVLMEGEIRREPQMGSARLAAVDDADEAEPIEPVALAPLPEPPKPLAPEEEPDPEFERVVEVGFGQPVSGDTLLPYLQNLKHAGRKPIRVFALTANGGVSLVLRPRENYTGLRFALFLANRSGPLSAIEYSEVVAKVQALADQFDGVADFPEMDEVVGQASELDQRASALDALVGLTLNARTGPWSLEMVVNAATRNGLTLLPDGRFHKVTEAGETLFVLAHPRGLPLEPGFGDGMRIEQLALILDVPQFKEQTSPFSYMTQVGQALADDLNAHLTDDGGRPVAAAASAGIDAQIQSLYGKLQAADLPAGTERTRRLFS
jgi:hypothetical protein